MQFHLWHTRVLNLFNVLMGYWHLNTNIIRIQIQYLFISAPTLQTLNKQSQKTKLNEKTAYFGKTYVQQFFASWLTLYYHLSVFDSLKSALMLLFLRWRSECVLDLLVCFTLLIISSAMALSLFFGIFPVPQKVFRVSFVYLQVFMGFLF